MLEMKNILFLTLIYTIFSQKIGENIADLRSNPMGISNKQDLIRVNLGISEETPNTRVVAYADINNDK